MTERSGMGMRPFSILSSPVAVLLLIFLLLAPSFFLSACAEKAAIRKRHYNRSGYSTPVRKKTGAYHPRRSTRYHTVRKGENLYRIARKYGRSVNQLKAANGIRDVTNLEVGARLRIPAASYKGSSHTKRKRGKKRGPRATRRSPSPRNLGIRLAWPLDRVNVTSRYGIRGAGKHDGVDLGAPRGTGIHAVATGTVIFSGPGPTGYGNVVIIKHNRRVISVYAHNEKNYVRKGAKVKRGDRVAAVGRTGRASGYHLHFELRVDRKPVDPERYLPRRR